MVCSINKVEAILDYCAVGCSFANTHKDYARRGQRLSLLRLCRAWNWRTKHEQWEFAQSLPCTRRQTEWRARAWLDYSEVRRRKTKSRRKKTKPNEGDTNRSQSWAIGFKWRFFWVKREKPSVLLYLTQTELLIWIIYSNFAPMQCAHV